MDPTNGVPRAIVDGPHLTGMRTRAVTAVGAKHLARPGSKVLAHIGARGTAYWNVRLLDHLFHFDEIRVHSRRPESRGAFAARLIRDLGPRVEGGKFGSLRAHVEAGKLSGSTLHAEIGQIVAGLKPGREREDETILFWHRGLSLSDIALGGAMLDKAAALGIGQTLRYA